MHIYIVCSGDGAGGSQAPGEHPLLAHALLPVMNANLLALNVSDDFRTKQHQALDSLPSTRN